MSSHRLHENRRESRCSVGHRMAQRAGGVGSPKKKTPLNLVAGFYHYLRGKCEHGCEAGSVCGCSVWVGFTVALQY